MTVKVTERGWAGHFICADRCLFRRNTLVEGEEDRVVVSTVGGMRARERGAGVEEIGAFGRFYETMVFGAYQEGEYIEADVSDARDFESEWAINAEKWEDLPDDIDNKANDMHEAVVAEFVTRFENPELLECAKAEADS